MEGIVVNVIIEPLLRVQSSVNVSLCEKAIRKTVVIGPNILVKNICLEIMNNVGLGHLSYNSEAFILVPDSKVSPYLFSLSSETISIVALKNVIGEPITVRVSAKGRPKDFTDEAMSKNICLNLIKLLLKEAPYVENLITDPVCKNIIETIRNPLIIPTLPTVSLQSLIVVKQVIETTLLNHILNTQKTLSRLYPLSHANNQNIVENNVPLLASKKMNIPENLDVKVQEPSEEAHVQIPTTKTFTPKECNSNFSFPLNINESTSLESEISSTNPPNPIPPVIKEGDGSPEGSPSSTSSSSLPSSDEMAVLEKWFQTIDKVPSLLELQVMAKHLNTVYSHPENSELTSEILFDWFINRKK